MPSSMPSAPPVSTGSDDHGETWKLVGTDPRIDSRAWYFSEVRVDPRNPDVVYVSNVSIYRSINAGETFSTIKGAPGGDDYHSLWIDPDNSQRMISASDQGVIISVDGGRSWSSWYNQATAQFYHVAVDNQFPYWVYGAQQDSGTTAVSSRCDFGQITFRDWHPIGAGESGYILPDPANPDIVYAGSTGGELYRFDARTGQVQDITPTPQSLGVKTRQRYPWTTPIAFSREHVLYQASQFLFRSTDDGMSWTIISPDLTLRPREKEETAQSVIYTIAPSAVRAGQIWIGTDNGLIKLTQDEGKSWQDVSPPGLPPWSMISLIDASPSDAGTAYAAIDRHQMDDLKPYIYRTHDFGKTWTKIANGILDTAYVHAVREDPQRKGRLFAGTELGVYVSFDDGDAWQSLQLNLPVTPIRDLVIKGDDLVVATHGRSFWILDDITPLRKLTPAIAAEEVYLFKPAPAFRLRKNEGHDTPLPPETPAGQNPPAGAIIDFSLRSIPAGAVTLEILDSKGNLVRKFSSNEQPRKVEDSRAYATYWQRPPAPLSRQAGMNRFVWDLRYVRPQALRYGTSIAAVYGDDVIMLPQGPLVLPGLYQVRLSVNGHTRTAPLEVKMDPRVKTPPAALEQQLALELKISEVMAENFSAARQIRDLRRQLRELKAKLANDDGNKPILDAAGALDEKAAALDGGDQLQFPPPTEPSLAALNGALGSLLASIDSADAAPTAQATAAYAAYSQLLSQQLVVWWRLKESDLASLNSLLRQRSIAELKIGAD